MQDLTRDLSPSEVVRVAGHITRGRGSPGYYARMALGRLLMDADARHMLAQTDYESLARLARDTATTQVPQVQAALEALQQRTEVRRSE